MGLRSNQVVFGIHNIWETTEDWENEAISSGLVTRRLYLKKKRTLNGHFSRPAETDPYVVKKTLNSWILPLGSLPTPILQLFITVHLSSSKSGSIYFEISRKSLKSNVRLQGTDEKLKDHEDIRDHASQYHDTTKDRECVAAVQSLPHGKTNLDNII